MWSHTYRNHVIIAFPSFDTTKRKWRAQADISWCRGSRRDSAFVRYNHRSTEAEAVGLALQQSMEWVDRRLTFEER